MHDQSLAPGVGVVVGTGVQRAAVVEDDRARRHRAVHGLGKIKIARVWYVVHGSFWVMRDGEDAVLV